MHFPALSPNLLIIAVMVGGMLYGAMAGKHRLRTLILSIYVGIVLATQFPAIIAHTIHQPLDLITLVLFFLPIILFGLGSGGHEHGGELVPNLIVGLATGGLIAASALSVLPPSEAKSLTDDSLVASLLLQYQLWLLALLPIAALFFGFMKAKEKKK